MTGLASIRVLEVAGAGSTAAAVGVAYAAKLFADLGADVIRLEGDGDLVRARPHDIARWLNTNKRSSQSTIESLIDDADLVLYDGTLGALAPDAATERWPSLVICAVTPFGLTGPYSDYAAEEITVMHGSSWGYLSPGGATDVTLPPLKAPGHHATINVATGAATAALAAVERARRTGHGEHIGFSMFAAAAKMTEFAPAAVSFLDQDPTRLGIKTVVPWRIYECADGLAQIICPEQQQWESLVEMMGAPEWALMDAVATQPARRDNSDVVDIYLAEWFATQTIDDLAIKAQEARVAITPVSTMGQLDANRQLNTRGFFVDDPDGVRLIGPGYRLGQPWWKLRSAAPEPGAQTGETWRARESILAETAPGPSSTRPLEGVRVCDFTWIWAGPFCTQHLAHLGAQVIKLESPDRPCLFRRFPFHPPGFEDHIDGSGSFQIYNSDKQSLGIDLNDPQAKEVVARLVAECDVVVDNFGVGTMAKMGFGIDDLRAMNPDLILASLSGYGQTGPSASYMAYGPAGGAMAGLYAANGYEGGPAVETGVAIGDPGTGITAAWAIVAALAARARTGIASTVDVAMGEAVAATVGELWMSYLSENENPKRIGNHDIAWAPHNCYPAAGDDNWLTIACTTDHEWQRLAAVLDPTGELAEDARFTTSERRKTNEAALDELVAGWTRLQDRWSATELLQARSIAAFPSVSATELWQGDPQLAESNMLSRPDHPVTGDRVVPGIPWQLHRGPNGLRMPAPCLAQHTDELLIDLLGYTPDEVARLHEAGAIYHPS